MLVVDSPFPPYKPVEYVFKGVPKETKDTVWSDEPEVVPVGTGNPKLAYSEFANSSTWAVDKLASRLDGRPAFKQTILPEGNFAWDGTKEVEASPNTIHNTFWYQQGELHRGGDLPAKISESSFGKRYQYFTFAVSHRFDDAQTINVDTVSGETTKSFFLYGAGFSEEKFFQIHANAIKYNVPLWVASFSLLFGVDLENPSFNPEDVKLFSTLPIEWSLQVLGLGNAKWGDVGIRQGNMFSTLVDPIRAVTEYEKGLRVNSNLSDWRIRVS